MTVAENIRKYLEDEGLMFKAVARKADIRKDSFSNAMNGKRKISVDEYIRICAALGVPITAFIPAETNDNTERKEM